MLGSMEISVGLASGMIAIAITLVQIIVPNALVVILVAVLRNEHPAVTWSVVSRTFASSLWPVVLRSDLATSRRNPLLINMVTWLKPLALLLISVAAIVTPIGLHEGLVLTQDSQMTTFAVLTDSGTMGYGTPPRSDLGFSRQCGGVEPVQCPGTTAPIEINGTNLTFNDEGLDRRIPKVLVELYQSGLSQQSRSVSSYFDIQARQYEYQNRYKGDNSSYLVDSFRAMGSRILDDSISLVDGLVVDMAKGGVGFRKHTAPAGLQYGAEWDEDILFLEPETTCVDINITLEVQISPANYTYDSTAPSGFLVDQGGFFDINKTSPYLEDWFDDLQTTLLEKGDPSLQARAYRAGWWMNVQNMYFFNVTKPGTNRSAYMNSALGQRFPVNNSYTSSDKDRLAFGEYYELFYGAPSAFEYANGTVDVYNGSYTSGAPYYSNPFNMTSLNWSDIGSLCTGALTGDYANLTNIDVRCGLLLGPAKRLDGSNSNIVEPGSWWTRPIYSCASATKASIKTVRFNYNSSNTGSLDSIKAVSISDKLYGNKSSMPIWGVETPNMKLRDVDPFYGLISPEKANSVNLTTFQSGHMYVPASSATVWASSISYAGTDFNPGVVGPPKIWNAVYGSSEYDGRTDYSGSNNLAMLQQWLGLSANSTGAAHICNLIWTDTATNYFTGTRSWLTPRDYLAPNLQKRQEGGGTNANTNTDDDVPVHVYVRRLQYHWVYGIPAFLVLLVSSAIVIGALLAALTGRGSLRRVRQYMWSLSPGRIMGAFMFPHEGDLYSDTKTWTENVGGRTIKILDEGSQVKGSPLSQVQYSQLNQKESTHQVSVATTTAFESEETEYNRQRL